MTAAKPKQEFTIDDWAGCYKDGWKGIIPNEAFCHPAKYGRSLIRRIYEHARAEGWMPEGARVIDPFGGIALGAYDASWFKAEWIGVELEPRFVTMANGMDCPGWSKADWVRFYGRAEKSPVCPACQPEPVRTVNGEQESSLFGWSLGSYVRDSGRIPTTAPHRYAGNLELWRNKGKGTARLIQGNSRRLSEILHEAGILISSPPFGSTLTGETRRDNSVLGQQQRGQSRMLGHNLGRSTEGDYGSTDGNLGNLTASDAGLEAVLLVSSPPYSSRTVHGQDGIEWDKTERRVPGRGGEHPSPGLSIKDGYGDSEGQLSTMRDSGFDLVVSSPPFVDARQGTTPSVKGNTPTAHDPEDFGTSTGQLGGMKDSGFQLAVGGEVRAGWKAGGIAAREPKLAPGYGETAGNVGNSNGETFWSAARQIVAETHKVLAPGAHAIWVLKRYVRKGEIVNFSSQWAQLCESVGFKVVHWHRAMLVENTGTQLGLTGDDTEITVARKSFFRRLHETKHPETSIDWEDVVCMRRL